MNLKEDIKETLIIIRGAGDLASGTAIRLHNSGFPVVMLDMEKPTSIRTTVSFSTALLQGTMEIENVKAKACKAEEVFSVLEQGFVAVIADPNAETIKQLKPTVVIDAILAKKNLGTTKDMAPFTIALGPGFEAGKDVDAVIETTRGHKLATIIRKGCAEPNTGIPGLVGGYGKERVMHTPKSGQFRAVHKIGDLVKKGEIVAYVDDEPIRTELSGKIRGMLPDMYVPENFKCADVDPRGEETDHTTISDKARSISGGVLEAIMNYLTEGK